MSKIIRRFAAVSLLTAVVTATPVVAAPARDYGADRERAPIVRVLKQIAKKIFGLLPTSGPIGPVPAPTTTTEP